MAVPSSAWHLRPEEGLARIGRPALVAGLGGGALCAAGALLDPAQFLRSYLVAYLFFVGATLGCLAVLMIQHAGLYASVNTLRGVAIDGRVPMFYMIGLLSREKDKDPRESRHSMVRYCEPLLDTFSVPHARLEGPNDVHLIPEYYRLSRARRGPAAVLVGLETA